MSVSLAALPQAISATFNKSSVHVLSSWPTILNQKRTKINRTVKNFSGLSMDFDGSG